MADTAAHLVDRLVPEGPFRQWVLTLSLRFEPRTPCCLSVARTGGSSHTTEPSAW
jgi:hypothetical protein